MKNNAIGGLLFVSVAFFGCVELPLGSEWLPQPTTGPSSIQLVRQQNYILGYNEASEQPVWVLYELLASELSDKRWKRTDNFRADPKVRTDSTSLADYRNSGYDRGHLAPAADMAFSEEAMSESFYLSNMSLQAHGFNRGVWRKLEKLIRNWALQYQQLIIVTAGVLTGQEVSQSLVHIGENQVWVPRYYYKIIYDPQRQSMIAFLLENQSYQFLDGENFSIFTTSVDKVEELTELDFFPQLPDNKEEAMESYSDVENWDFGE